MALRTSQVVVEGLAYTINGVAHASQSVIEVFSQTSSIVGHARASQTTLEVLSRTPAPTVRGSQLVIEIFNTRPRVVQAQLFPELIGLSYSVLKTPDMNTAIIEHISGRRKGVRYFDYPLWMYELNYEYLPDYTPGVQDPTTVPNQSDYETLRSFWVNTYGGTYPFFFRDPDDFQVVGQTLATTDGVQRVFFLIRSYGASGFETTEPVGFVDGTNYPFNLYLDGVLVNPTDYTLQTTEFGLQYVIFFARPTTGQVLSCDMTYYYFVRFADPLLEFEQFITQIYNLKKLRFETRRSA